MFDVLFVSYDEPNADANYERLLLFAPRAKRVHGIEGMANAYIRAAQLSDTPHFFFVDADNWILDGFDFELPEAVLNDVCLWKARNAVNGIQWFNGAIKLLSKQSALSNNPKAVDFFLSLSGTRKIVNHVASETRFNSSPFQSWRSGFRECAKLAGGLIRHPQVDELIRIWTTLGSEAPNGPWCILGARQGAEFGKKNFRTPLLGRINDMDWLSSEFSKSSL
jgi:hypothetical protein